MRAVNQSLPKGQTDGLGTFWTLTPEAVCVTLHCELGGLSSSEAERRLAQYGPNSDAETKADSTCAQLTTPGDRLRLTSSAFGPSVEEAG